VTDDEVLTERDGAILVITLNRPKARNAVNAALAKGLAAAADELDADRSLTVGVLTGAGGTFCSGMDLKAFLKGEVPVVDDRGFAGITVRGPDKPLIAAVEGYALAGGCEIALACDLIVASTEAQFGIPEVKRSLVAAGGGLFRLPLALPAKVALELALTGDPITAQRAYDLGLVNELCEPGQAVDTAVALAERICVNAPVAVRESRKVVLQALGTDDEKALWDASNAAFAKVAQTEDFSEGPLAFIEKRSPSWKGR
jgi:enoyl-CoA hydratase